MTMSNYTRSLIFLLLHVVQFCYGRVGKWDVFATKTAYNWAHLGDREGLIPDLAANVTFRNSTWNAVHITMAVRHGSRNPGTAQIHKISEVYKKIIRSKDPSKFTELDTWANSYEMETANYLTKYGQGEMYSLGHRIGMRFNSLFKSSALNIDYYSSAKIRAIDSSKHFYQGLKSQHQHIGVHDNIVESFSVRSYDDCTALNEQLKHKNHYFREAIRLEHKKEFRSIVEAVASRLGLNESLTIDDLYTLHDLCAYDKINQNFTAWCDLLTDEERLVLEYAQDLREFYERSYGNPINAEMTCPIVSDMFTGFDNVIEMLKKKDNSHLTAKFVFGHLGGVMRLMTVFGLFNDHIPLRADNRVVLEDRKFRSSDIAPFAANIALVLYASEDDPTSFAMKFFVNEEETIVEGCDSVMCPYEQLRKTYSHMIDNCDFNAVCATVSHSSNLTWSIAAIVLGFIILALADKEV